MLSFKDDSRILLKSAPLTFFVGLNSNLYFSEFNPTKLLAFSRNSFIMRTPSLYWILKILSQESYCAVQNSGYFSSKLDQTIFLCKEDDKNTNCLIMLANMPPAPILRPKTSRLSTPSIKAHLNNEKMCSVPVQRTKRGKQRAASVEIVSDDEEPEIPISTKKLPPPPVLGEYLLTARTCVGIQPVYRESQSTMSGLWSARHYFDESTKKAGAMTNERGIEPVLQSSMATIYSKAMKPAEYITNEV